MNSLTFPKMTQGRWLCVLGLTLMAHGLFLASNAEAAGRGYSSSRSSFSSSRSYSRPAPRPVVVNKTVVNRTTVVQQNHVSSAPAGAGGGGFFSSFLGAAAGAGVTNAIMNDDKASEAPAAAPAPQAVQCLGADQKIVPCPAPGAAQ